MQEGICDCEYGYKLASGSNIKCLNICKLASNIGCAIYTTRFYAPLEGASIEMLTNF